MPRSFKAMLVIFAIIVGALFLWLAKPAHAAFCGKYEVFREALERKYGEVSLAKGVVASGFIIELFVSKQGSFTLLSVSPQGMTCIIAGGEGWANTEKIIPGEKSELFEGPAR